MPVHSNYNWNVGGGGNSFTYNDPYMYTNTTSTLTTQFAYVGGTNYVPPPREPTALEWLASQVESVCKRGRL